MYRSWFNKMWVITIVTVTGVTQAAEVISGDGAPGESFSFPIQQHVMTNSGRSIFIAAAPGSAPKEYAVSVVGRTMNAFVPIAQQKVTINGDSDQENPLYDAGISSMVVLQSLSGETEKPMVVTETDPTRVYVIENTNNLANIIMSATEPLRDAQGLVSSGAVALAAVSEVQGFAAVKNNAGDNFGAPGSGIAYIAKIGHRQVEDQQIVRAVEQFEQINSANESTQTVRATALDLNSDAIKIGSTVAGIGTIVDMWWKMPPAGMPIGRLYIGLDVTASGNPGDGARAVVVARQQGFSTLVIEQILDDAAFVANANNEIVGTRTPNAQVSAFKVRTMSTSTRLDYLIVLGGNTGGPNPPSRTVYALPLVADPQNVTAHGTLASRNAVPTDLFVGEREQLAYRFLKQQATTPADIFTNTDPQVLVGGGPIAAGDITDITVRSDAVYVAVGNPIVNQLPGIFVSYALFDELGKIKGWTQWQRVAGTTDMTFGVMYDAYFGNFVTMVGDNENSINTVKRTLWSYGALNGLADLSAAFAHELPPLIGGIQGLIDQPAATLGLGGVSWLIATGLQKIVIAETGVVTNNVVVPNSGDFTTDQQLFTDGTIGVIPNTAKLLTIFGGALDELGPINCAQVIANQNNAYLALGGVNGLAVLTQQNGAGWNTVTGISAGFANLPVGARFVRVGNYTFVRKIVSDQKFMYVLTDSVLDRIDIAASNFATGVLSVVRLASITDIPAVGLSGSFLDLVVSQKIGLLATNNGLFRVGNGVNIANGAITNPADLGWTAVVLPQELRPVTYLVPLTPTQLGIDVATGVGGTVYVVSGDIGNNRARLSRISVKNLTGLNEIDDTSVLPLNDIFVKDSLSYFLNLSAFRNIYATDGAARFITNERELVIPANVFLLPPNISTGGQLAAISAQSLLSVLPSGFAGALEVTSLLRSSASGSWLLASDVGMFVNE